MTQALGPRGKQGRTWIHLPVKNESALSCNRHTATVQSVRISLIRRHSFGILRRSPANQFTITRVFVDMDTTLIKTKFEKLGARAKVRPLVRNRWQPATSQIVIDVRHDRHGEFFRHAGGRRLPMWRCWTFSRKTATCS